MSRPGRWLHLLLVLLLAAPRLARAEDPAPIEITILFLNDIHGHLEPFTVEDKARGIVEHWGGVARLAGEVRRIRDENAKRGVKTFVLYGGDLLMGTPMSTVFQGVPDMKCLLAMGVDAFVIGNHEFDFGLGPLAKLVEMGGTTCPIISCNIDREDGQPFVPGAVLFPIGQGHDLKVVGITTPETPLKTTPDNVKGLVFKDPVERVRREIERHAAKPGPVVVISHCGWQADAEVATHVRGIPLIAGGHDQILMFPARKVEETWLLQAFEKCKFLGRADLSYDYATRKAEVFSTTMYKITPRLPEDPACKAIVAEYAAQMSAKFAETICTAKTFLDGERGRIRYEETNLGNLLADIMRQRTNAQVALLNAGAIRSSINEGPVTMGDVLKAVPYANDLMTVRLEGRVLRAMLERAVKCARDEEDGGFLHVSGISLAIEGRTLATAKVGDVPLDDGAIYTVAVTSFMKSGGDGYHWLVDLPCDNTRVLLRDAVMDELRRRGEVDAKVDGRIVRK